jgi:cytochrome c peroxidase
MATDPTGSRAFTEALSRSWRPWRRRDPGRETLRNTPTLFDLSAAAYLHLDGEFLSLEELSRETLVGRNFGWFPDERREALEYLRSVIQGDDGKSSYSRQFEMAYGLDLASLTPEALLQAVATAMADFMRTLQSERNSPYDEFLAANAVDAEPRSGEGSRDYGLRTLEHLTRLRGEQAVTYVDGFGSIALTGYEMFLRSSGTTGVGNCVVCHVPPNFVDGSFHNTGVTQGEYDGLHGEGSFARLEIPNRMELPESLAQFRSIPSRRAPGSTDLGYWNFARVGSSPVYRTGESPAAFFRRTVARFKTPTLRHLASTSPYNHNGGYATLQRVLEQKLRASELARSGRLRNADPELAKVRISPDDIRGLVAFLEALNEGSRRTSHD